MKAPIFILLGMLPLGAFNAVSAGQFTPNSQVDQYAKDVLSLDDKTRQNAQWRLGLETHKVKNLVPVLVKSLDIEGRRTEERMAENEQKGTRIRNPQNAIANAIFLLKQYGGKEVLPDIVQFRENHSRLNKYWWFSNMMDQVIFELEHDISKSINTDTLQVSMHTEDGNVDFSSPSSRNPDARARYAFPLNGDMAVSYSIFSAQTNPPAFCAYATEVLIDKKVVYSSGSPHVWQPNVSGRIHRISLNGFSNGLHTVTLRLKDTDISSSTNIFVLPK